ncbi:phosphomethylpyrimidine synthase ThiC [Methanocella arvoryzae]|uniref:Phosphomethylpyrimidine synthase n=1 Tax=Methanocella arvoryzae (strain DSM 22066 / NBRC 105507 / MRE50) TaxID=351160 RepID=Q0W7P1_METAR|nr:phosphomethylpyrimidine synthase ThiC [Methanocella arvoryzae]CAJ35602.1 thiamine biosynthesis protein [Methanocella arvoryzae MRE50]
MLIRDAKKGISHDIWEVSRREGVSADQLRGLLASGQVVIPKNVARNFPARAIGKYMSTKINANVGTSKDYDNPADEVEKARVAVKYGADAVMDLSTGSDIDAVRRRLVKEIDVPVGTVPIYHAARKRKNVVDMSSDDIFNSIREHAKDGVDFITVHCGVTMSTLDRLRRDPRVMNVVSRGGAFTIAWMLHNEAENPLYEEFDYLLEIAAEHDLTLSLGDGMRPGCMADASDRAQFMEVITLGELVGRCREKDVQSMVEGPGHVPLDEVGTSVSTMKKLTRDAPLYLLGPLVTDIAPGYDHIVGAIGGSIAGMYGADFLCMVTPSEHLALPTADDIREGTVVTKIAAHVADTVKEGQRELARARDLDMSRARGGLDWAKQYELAIDPEKARNIRETRMTASDACSMCGDLCAIKIVKDALKESKR